MGGNLISQGETGDLLGMGSTGLGSSGAVTGSINSLGEGTSNPLGGEAMSMGMSTGNMKVGAKTKIIKRYQNRKLYDTQQSCYVTLDDIAKMIRTNEDVMVVDNKSKNDITAATLTQIIFESEKKASQYAPLFTLREIIQNGNGSISSFLAKLGAFPQDYAKPEAAAPALDRSSYDDVKQTLENRVARAAADSADFTTNGGAKFGEEQTPSLPNSNKSLNN